VSEAVSRWNWRGGTAAQLFPELGGVADEQCANSLSMDVKKRSNPFVGF
jgi:hypothetical protein